MIILEVDFLKSATGPDGYPPIGPREVAFCGRSNVGKSSCLNTLANRKQLARVSGTPGRTRMINFFDLTVAEKTRSGGRGPELKIRFADLPGYGFAKGPKSDREEWKKMIERYLTERDAVALKALVVLVDGELGAQPSDLEMVRWAETLGRKVIVVATKLDRLPRTRRQAQIDRIAGTLAVPHVLAFSAEEKFGVDELWKALVTA